MEIFTIKTRAMFEQAYNIEAETLEEAKRIAKDNTCIDQIQKSVEDAEILKILN